MLRSHKTSSYSNIMKIDCVNRNFSTNLLRLTKTLCSCQMHASGDTDVLASNLTSTDEHKEDTYPGKKRCQEQTPYCDVINVMCEELDIS